MQPPFSEDEHLDGLIRALRKVVRPVAARLQALEAGVRVSLQVLVASLTTDAELLAQIGDRKSTAPGQWDKASNLSIEVTPPSPLRPVRAMARQGFSTAWLPSAFARGFGETRMCNLSPWTVCHLSCRFEPAFEWWRSKGSNFTISRDSSFVRATTAINSSFALSLNSSTARNAPISLLS